MIDGLQEGQLDSLSLSLTDDVRRRRIAPRLLLAFRTSPIGLTAEDDVKIVCVPYSFSPSHAYSLYTKGFLRHKKGPVMRTFACFCTLP